MIVIIPLLIATALLSYFGAYFRLAEVHHHLLFAKNAFEVAVVAQLQLVENVKIVVSAYWSPVIVDYRMFPTRTISFAEYAQRSSLYFPVTRTLPVFLKEESIMPRVCAAIFVLIGVATLVYALYNVEAWEIAGELTRVKDLEADRLEATRFYAAPQVPEVFFFEEVFDMLHFVPEIDGRFSCATAAPVNSTLENAVQSAAVHLYSAYVDAPATPSPVRIVSSIKNLIVRPALSEFDVNALAMETGSVIHPVVLTPVVPTLPVEPTVSAFRSHYTAITFESTFYTPIATPPFILNVSPPPPARDYTVTDSAVDPAWTQTHPFFHATFPTGPPVAPIYPVSPTLTATTTDDADFFEIPELDELDFDVDSSPAELDFDFNAASGLPGAFPVTFEAPPAPRRFINRRFKFPLLAFPEHYSQSFIASPRPKIPGFPNKRDQVVFSQWGEETSDVVRYAKTGCSADKFDADDASFGEFYDNSKLFHDEHFDGQALERDAGLKYIHPFVRRAILSRPDTTPASDYLVAPAARVQPAFTVDFGKNSEAEIPQPPGAFPRSEEDNVLIFAQDLLVSLGCL